MEDEAPDIIHGETCPFCNQKTLTLMEAERDIPHFGLCYLFSMSCSNCKYHKSDVETEKGAGKVKYELTIDSEEDMNIRVVKASSATVKLGRIGSIESGEQSNGYITNVEGVLNRIKSAMEFLRDDAEDDADKKKAKNALKKLQRIMWGQEPAVLTIDDPEGNSAIISEKAKKVK
ncbi:MAG: ZPR1 zinc finger domain-containing protein [Candidatus Woesearchaeota archaeon]